MIFLRDLATGGAHLGFTFQIIVWLFLTVLFANFATGLAEARGRAQADPCAGPGAIRPRTDCDAEGTRMEEVPSTDSDPAIVVVVTAGQIIPSDGEMIEGIASVDESAITGESAPVIREAGGDRSGVTGGTGFSRTESWCALPRRPGSPSSIA